MCFARDQADGASSHAVSKVLGPCCGRMSPQQGAWQHPATCIPVTCFLMGDSGQGLHGVRASEMNITISPMLVTDQSVGLEGTAGGRLEVWTPPAPHPPVITPSGQPVAMFVASLLFGAQFRGPTWGRSSCVGESRGCFSWTGSPWGPPWER